MFALYCSTVIPKRKANTTKKLTRVRRIRFKNIIWYYYSENTVRFLSGILVFTAVQAYNTFLHEKMKRRFRCDRQQNISLTATAHLPHHRFTDGDRKKRPAVPGLKRRLPRKKPNLANLYYAFEKLKAKRFL